MKITMPVAKSNIPSANGNIYPSEVLFKMAKELNKNKEKIIYFELNHWTPGLGYPMAEPFRSWMNDFYKTEEEKEKSWVNSAKILNEKFKKEGLVVVMASIDMSLNYCVAARESWVKQNCPELLTKYTDFLRMSTEEDDDEPPHGEFWTHFVKWSEENCGLWFDEECQSEEDEDEFYWELTRYEGDK